MKEQTLGMVKNGRKKKMMIKKIVSGAFSLIVLSLISCSGTPKNFKNSNSLESGKFLKEISEIEPVLKKYVLTSSMVPKCQIEERKEPIDLEIINAFFDESGSKVVFLVVETIENDENYRKFVNKEMGDYRYCGFFFKGERLNNGEWSVEFIHQFVMINANSKDSIISFLKKAFFKHLSEVRYSDGSKKFKYNIDDKRIFDGVLFE